MNGPGGSGDLGFMPLLRTVSMHPREHLAGIDAEDGLLEGRSRGERSIDVRAWIPSDGRRMD
jgi:hypothetical protein